MTQTPPHNQHHATKLPHARPGQGIWLMKSEPDEYSIDDWERQKTTLWTGVRNYQARNFMRDQMRLNDLVLFYHSNAKPPALVGWGTVTQLHQVDPTQFYPKSPYYDPKSKPDHPTWICVTVTFGGRFPSPLTLPFLRAQKELSSMLLFKKGQRLSIQPVTSSEWKILRDLADIARPKDIRSRN